MREEGRGAASARTLVCCLLWLLLLALPPGYCLAQNTRVDRPPRLLVQIVMGAVSPEQITAIWERLNPKGIPRLYAKGIVASDARYPQLVCNAPNGLATLMTGASPSRHGVIGNAWYSHVTGQLQTFAEDFSCHTLGAVGGSSAPSPKRLLVGTLVESWRQSYPHSQIYAFSLAPLEAILLGGRAANAAFWLDKATGKMVTTSYYTEALPEWMQRFNAGVATAQYLMRQWSPSPMRASAHPRARLPKGEGKTAPEIKVLGPKFTRLFYTPMGNSLLKDLLVLAVDKGGLGKGKPPALASLYLSSLEGISALYGPESPQMQDALLRFDSELADLIDYLDFAVGKKEYAIVLTSAYAAAPSPRDLEAQRIPAGIFNPDRALLMLNSYLGALYHDPKMALGYCGQQFYLNLQTIEARRISLETIVAQAAAFLQDMAGVAAVYPATALQWGSDANERIRRASEGFCNRRSGTLLVDLLPGWILAPKFSPKAANALCSTRPRVPLILYGWKLPHRIVVRRVSLRDVVPTLCHLFYLPTPNASEGTPLEGIADWDQ